MGNCGPWGPGMVSQQEPARKRPKWRAKPWRMELDAMYTSVPSYLKTVFQSDSLLSLVL